MQALTHIPALLSRPFQWVRTKTDETRRKVNQYWQTKKADFEQSTFWRSYGEPFYKTKIKPLTITDIKIFSGVMFIAGLITAIGALYFPELIHVAACMGAIVVLLGCRLINRRLESHFDGIAWEYIETIRKSASSLNFDNASTQMDEIRTAKTALNKSEYSHLKEQINDLNVKIDRLLDAVNVPENKDRPILDNNRKELLTLAEDFMEKLCPGKQFKK